MYRDGTKEEIKLEFLNTAFWYINRSKGYEYMFEIDQSSKIYIANLPDQTLYEIATYHEVRKGTIL